MPQKSLFADLIEYYPRGEETLVKKDFVYSTKKLTFNMHYKHKLITLAELKKYLVSDIGCLNGGLTCSNYKNCYSCPPSAPSLDKYNSQNYQFALIYCFYADWDIPIKSDNPYFKLINLNRTLSPYSSEYGKKLERLLGGKDMIDGRCHECKKCNYPHGCLHPAERRSSLEAVNLDASRLSEEILEHKIEWYRKVGKDIVVPRFLTVIHGLLTNSQQPKEML